MAKLRVLNVDDSAFMRKLLKDTLERDSDIGEILQAKNGKEALDILEKEDFDCITLDIEMPVMDGIETLKVIMKKKPTPVVMISTATQKYAKITLDALELGAVDFIAKPKNIFSLDNEQLDNIVEVVKSAASSNTGTLVKRIRPLPGKKGFDTSVVTIKKIETQVPRDSEPIFDRHKGFGFSKDIEKVNKIIVIGTSTGGPRALQAVLPLISGKIDVPILIVQHMPKGFTKSLADRLDSISDIGVKEAEDGETLKNGIAYIAPGGLHLKIKSVGIDKYKIYLDDSPPFNSHKPSVDVMFDSVAMSPVDQVISVIMTGMGADGAKGLENLKLKKNAITIAEDESTCVVYGMPKSAVETGKVDKVVPLNKIATELNKLMGV